MFSEGLIQGSAVRIAAVAAFLACALLGRPLHEWQHHSASSEAGQSQVVSSEAGSRCSGHKCQGDSGTTVAHRACGSSLGHSHGHEPHSHGPEGDHPGHSHDSHDCSVCQALCVSATSPDSTSPSELPELCVERNPVSSERASAFRLRSADARGPPNLV